MDTNQQNKPNNICVNAFVKGMNSDTSYDQVPTESYIFGQNIRITNNTLLQQLTDANNTENVVAPVSSGFKVNIRNCYTTNTKSILATASVGNIGVIITKTKDDYWEVYRAELTDDCIDLTFLFRSTEQTDKERFSVVINRELADVIKVYIADGEHEIMQLNLQDPEYYTNLQASGYLIEDCLISNHIYPSSKIKIAEKISGQLKTSQVQYTYRLYKKYGITSKLAPLTNKIQVISNNRKMETGNAYDTLTPIGLRLHVDIDPANRLIFDHIQVYRMTYLAKDENAQIDLIWDASIDSDKVIVNDTGLKSLAGLNIDEFAALDGQSIVPEIIEQNQGYLFASNILDKSVIQIETSELDTRAFQCDLNGNIVLYSDAEHTEQYSTNTVEGIPAKYSYNEYTNINLPDGGTTFGKKDLSKACAYTVDSNKYLGGTGPVVSWRFVTTQVPIDSVSKDSTNPPSTINTSTQAMYYIKTSSKLAKNWSYETLFKCLQKTKYTTSQYLEQQGITAASTVSYDDMFTSSLLRSLRRDEVYRYGLVLYTKSGTHSDVLWIADIRTPMASEFPITVNTESTTYALPLGIEFSVNLPQNIIDKYNIHSYQIVRCEKNNNTTRNLLQCVLSRPVRQGKAGETNSEYRTPYYPSYLLTTEYMYMNAWMLPQDVWNSFFLKYATNVENDTLYQMFAPSILYTRNDVNSVLSNVDTKMHVVSYVSCGSNDDITKQFNPPNGIIAPIHRPWAYYANTDATFQVTSSLEKDNSVHKISDGVFFQNQEHIGFSKSSKSGDVKVFRGYADLFDLSDYNTNDVEIKQVSDVKNPTWEQGFTDIKIEGNTVIGGVKQYKSYQTSLGNSNYVNWIANSMYDLAVGTYDANAQFNNARYKVYASEENATYIESPNHYIGPGPVCLLAEITKPDSDSVFKKSITAYDYTTGAEQHTLGTLRVNITHNATQFSGTASEEKQYDIYYGFGNFSKLGNAQVVFDGDTYIVPAEFTTMYKTYDFNDARTLPSTQVVYYIPIETPVNTFFDYGMNYRNTSNTNLQLEPGVISGITSQDRPAHQYNAVYSDNNRSNDVFSAQPLEKLQEDFPQRIFYSTRKTNGENVDQWNMFKAVDFIDADTRYGELTHMITSKDVLYFWQENAFGKLSVNERSLITDNNSNTIQLGQGGVLQRTDYINTRYGMRKEDMCATLADDAIYWIDVQNKAIALHRQGSVVNLSEAVNVQNIVNEYLTEDYRPTVDYDLQAMEILCGMKDKQLVFSTKTGLATSLYTRRYNSIIEFNNTLYGLNKDSREAVKYNYLTKEEHTTYLAPTILSFVVNTSAAQTKVFDNQKVVTLSRAYDKDFVKRYMQHKTYEFVTDLNQSTIGKLTTEAITDREGNILYSVPRHNDEINGIPQYGQRLRGKWMRVTITDDNPAHDFVISHILTTFRQSNI